MRCDDGDDKRRLFIFICESMSLQVDNITTI